MKEFGYSMPVEIIFGRNIIIENYEIFKRYGKKAMIITGGGSSKKNGSFGDVEKALKKANINYLVFEGVEENPSVETVSKAVQIAKDFEVEFIIGIGGGSPIDAGKAVAILLDNSNILAKDIFDNKNLSSIPLIAIPTTAGTGTEVTQYAVLTDHNAKTKRNFNQSVFPRVAFLDARYLMTTPYQITVNTAVDALSHLIEGFLSTKSNFMSDIFVREGLSLFKELKESLEAKIIDIDTREQLLWMSTLAGIVIAQAGTSLPHGMGYPLTYNKEIKHGAVNGILLAQYLNISSSMKKVDEIIEILDFENIEEFNQYIINILGDFDFKVSEEEIKKYTEMIMQNKSKLKNHPLEISYDEIYQTYKKSLLKYII